MNLPIYVVNVFSEAGIAGGNQLAVVFNTDQLTDRQMQQVAKQMNYSESVFVTKDTREELHFRIFLPTSEIYYAGHPIIGTAHLVEYLSREEMEAREKVLVQVRSGPVNIQFLPTDRGFRTTMEQLPVSHLGDFGPNPTLLEALGISQTDMGHSELPILAPSNLKFVFLHLKSSELVNSLQPDLFKLSSVLATDESLFIFSETETAGYYNTRMFAPNQGIVEDPATGSAQGAFVEVLQKLDMLNSQSEIKVKQGEAMGRPSVIYNYIDTSNGLKVRTGGNVHLVLKGELFIE